MGLTSAERGNRKTGDPIRSQHPTFILSLEAGKKDAGTPGSRGNRLLQFGNLSDVIN
jgi:hypothetical protein